MVDWTSGTTDASAAERETAFIPLRVPGSPDVFKETLVSNFLTKDASGVRTIPDEAFDEKLRMRGANSFIGFYNSAATIRQGYVGQFGANQYYWNDSNGATIFGNNNIEGARFDASRNFMIGTAAALANSKLSVQQAGAAGVPALSIAHTAASGTRYFAAFYKAGGVEVGNITTDGTTTTYGTSSDYRLKDNVEDLTGSGDFIDALRPRKWLWNQDGSPGAGFIAHEFAEVSPSSVSGEKDGVREGLLVNEETGEEELVSEPAYQSMQASSPEVMAHIIAELQSLRARVAALESGQA